MKGVVEKHHIEALKLALEESKINLTKDKSNIDHDQLLAQTRWLGRRKRAMELVAARGQLRQALRHSQESTAKLENELRHSRMREAELLAEYHSLKHRLALAQFPKFA